MTITINLGCGKKQCNNCINIDIRREVSPQILADIEKPLPLKNGCADYILMHDVIEHFTLNETKNIIRECQRILKISGYLQIKTTYFDAVIQAYRKRLFSEPETIRRIFGTQDYKYNLHKYIYNPGLLSDIVANNGFPVQRVEEDRELGINFTLTAQKQ